MTSKPGFEVRDERIEEILRALGDHLREITAGTGYGFALLIFSFGDKGNMFYTSNANRQDMCNSMREFIAKHEPN